MFDNPYKFSYKNHKKIKENELVYYEHKIVFRSKKKHRYIINVEEYPNFVLVVKFHLKSHSESQNKYRLLTGFHEAPRVIATLIDVMFFFLKRNPFSSFGFIASQTMNEPSSAFTKRFRLYTRIMADAFSPVDFMHYEYQKESCYLLLNRLQYEIDKNVFGEIETMFKNHYLFIQ